MLDNLYFYINFMHQNLENNYIIFFLLYFFTIICFFAFSLPGGPIPIMASGFFFGFYVGFFINIFSVLIGSYFFVFFAQNILKKFFNKFYLKLSTKFNNIIKDSTYEYLIIFRLIQGNPLFVQNLCLSFLDISKIKFFITSFLGLSPPILIFTYIGSKFYEIYEIKNINYSEIISKDFLLFISIIILLLIFRIFYKKKIKK